MLTNSYYIDINIEDGCICLIMTSYIKNLNRKLYLIQILIKKQTKQNKLLLKNKSFFFNGSIHLIYILKLYNNTNLK